MVTNHKINLFSSSHSLVCSCAEHTQNFTRFSAWFGNNSHQGKQKRLLAELSCNMAAAKSGATCSRASVRLDYLPAFRTVRISSCALLCCSIMAAWQPPASTSMACLLGMPACAACLMPAL
jgi:hypothetical protein